MRTARGSTSTAPTANREASSSDSSSTASPGSRRRGRPTGTRRSGPASMPARRSRRIRGPPPSSCPCATRRAPSSAGVALDVDPRRYVAEAFETWQPPGDIWFATDAAGHALLDDAARGGGPRLERRRGRACSRTRPRPSCKRLAARDPAGAAVGGAVPRGRQGDAGSPRRASARPDGCFSRALARGPRHDPRRGGAGVPAGVVLAPAARRPSALRAALAGRARRRSASCPAASRRPCGELVRAAEEIGRGRAVEIAGRAAPGTSSGASPRRSTRWASASSGASRPCAGCTSSRGSAYRMTDFQEVLGALDPGHRRVHRRRARLVLTSTTRTRTGSRPRCRPGT